MGDSSNAGAGAQEAKPGGAPAAPRIEFECDGCHSSNLEVDFYDRAGKRMARWRCRDCRATGRERL